MTQRKVLVTGTAGFIGFHLAKLLIAEGSRWHESGDIIWHGQLSDVRSAIAQSHVYVLPSYREGSCSEIYLEKAFDGTGWRPEQSLPVAKELGATSLMFLVHPTLSHENIDDAVMTIRDVLSAATS